MRERGLLYLLVSLLAACHLPAQAARVVTKDRSFDDVRIIQDELKGVEGRIGASRHAWNAAEIVSIDYATRPEAFAKASRLFRDGEFARAAELFQASFADASKYPWLRAYATWFRAVALERSGSSDEALPVYEALLALDPKPRFVPDACLAISGIHFAKGPEGLEPARKVLQELRALVKERSLPERYELLASLGLGRVELATDANAAAATLDRLIARSAGHPDIANLARLELGNAYNARKDYAKAESCFRVIVESAKAASDDPAILAGALNGLADAQLRQEKYALALETYSKTYVFFADRSDLRERVAHALFHGATAFESESGRLRATDYEKADLYLKRSKQLLRKAAREFADTAAGAQARKSLGS